LALAAQAALGLLCQQTALHRQFLAQLYLPSALLAADMVAIGQTMLFLQPPHPAALEEARRAQPVALQQVLLEHQAKGSKAATLLLFPQAAHLAAVAGLVLLGKTLFRPVLLALAALELRHPSQALQLLTLAAVVVECTLVVHLALVEVVVAALAEQAAAQQLLARLTRAAAVVGAAQQR
jgi:hypothetical protein